MAKQVTHAVELRDPIQPDVGVDRLLYVVKCDDDSIYEFQTMEDAPLWEFRSRGELGDAIRDWSTASRRLPANVKELLNERLGRGKWQN
jgi:hypothetical protein